MSVASKRLKKPNELTLVLVGTDSNVRSVFEKRGYNVKSILHLKDPKSYDGVIFTGGGDISPYLYGQGLHPRTHPDYSRDLREMAVLRAIPRWMPKIGICRGGQLLNVYSGGDMIQDVNNHGTGSHKVKCLMTGKEFTVSTLHHQAMNPSTDGWVLAVASESTKRATYHDVEYIDSTTQKDHDIEAVYYEHTKCYCFQGHPEYGYAPESETLFFTQMEAVFADVWSTTAPAQTTEDDANPREVRCG